MDSWGFTVCLATNFWGCTLGAVDAIHAYQPKFAAMSYRQNNDRRRKAVKCYISLSSWCITMLVCANDMHAWYIVTEVVKNNRPSALSVFFGLFWFAPSCLVSREPVWYIPARLPPLSSHTCLIWLHKILTFHFISQWIKSNIVFAACFIEARNSCFAVFFSRLRIVSNRSSFVLTL